MVQSTGRSSALPFPEDLRPKQKEIIDAFRTKKSLIAKLPTGYGKTLAAAGAFAMSCHLGNANRMLVVAERRNQARQLAEDIPDALLQFGMQAKSCIVGDHPIRALKDHAKGIVTIFVVTIQSATDTWSTVQELMQTGLWFLYIDEHHHFGDDEGIANAWTEKLKTLNYSALLAMSATPNRHDGTDHFPDPDISETYKNAAKEGYVKTLSLDAYHYTIDAVTIDGQVFKFTTEELRDAAQSESPDAIDAYLTSKKMRFSPKYVSPLVMFPVDRLIDLRARGIKSQMLIQAMSCSHARVIFDQVKAQLPENIKVDWVGTGPSGRLQEENDDVLKRFCPKKNKATGKRPWTLEILINVGMCGESMDTIDVTEISFLTPANNTIMNKQTMGRGARRMDVGELKQPICNINVDTGSVLQKYIGEEIMTIFDEGIDDYAPIEREFAELRDYEELPEKLGWTVVDCRLLEIRRSPMYEALFPIAREKTDLARSDEEVAAMLEQEINNYLNRSNNQSAINEQKIDQIEAANSKIAGLVIRRMAELGMRIEKTLAGDLRRRINTQKKRELGSVRDADADLDAHWAWLKRLERTILLEHGLIGVPQWLR